MNDKPTVKIMGGSEMGLAVSINNKYISETHICQCVRKLCILLPLSLTVLVVVTAPYTVTSMGH